jgi:hypothetical protein
MGFRTNNNPMKYRSSITAKKALRISIVNTILILFLYVLIIWKL